ncbi:putative DNA-binding pseudobarrel domain superfamily, REM family [Helianthus annuus]|nr:putative DNA-binding pseudobarrel domain superfamily, REM family [Helianthus annuus]KAJ0585914.1 putative DNA-binding pseudobarrel domain superfamily, REM family [Helianthus annuus]
MATIYVGERFWNVMMKGWTDGCGFTDGWLKLVEEVPIAVESWLVFTMIASKTFELSVFHPETGTKVFFKKVDVVVLDDSVNGDDGFDLLAAAKHKQVLDSGEVALDDDETGSLVGNSKQFTSFENIFNSADDGLFDSKVARLVDELDVKNVPEDHSVKIDDDVNDPQLQSKDFSVRDIPACSSVVSNVSVY